MQKLRMSDSCLTSFRNLFNINGAQLKCALFLVYYIKFCIASSNVVFALYIIITSTE